MTENALFQGVAEKRDPPSRVAPGAKPRLQIADRSQMELRVVDLDRLVADDDEVRSVWAFVEGRDLGALYATIKAVEGNVGRPPIDPKILVALWLYATLQGVGSARALDRLCESHVAYQWLCGGVSVNYHTLADFRVAHGAILERMLTESVATLMASGVVTLRRVAQDGMRVRASAGAASFRRKATLDECLRAAEEQVKSLRKQLDEDPGEEARRRKAAQLRAAEDRQRRVEEALRQLPAVEEIKARNRRKGDAPKKSEARCSTTDPDARVMKMADGGYRPAVNAQIATDVESRLVVAVDVNNRGNDHGHMSPMVEKLTASYGKPPEAILVDGGFVTVEEIEKTSASSVVYAPPMKPRDPGRDPHAPLPTDSAAVAEWRVRMGTDAAKEIYKERASTAECVNANFRNHGLQQLSVRGLGKAKAILLWFALAHNLLQMIALGVAGTA